jgi:Predicted solute binding protein
VKKTFGLLILILLPLSVALPVAASPGKDNNVRLCHATSSETNPYVTITVDPASVVFEGHDGHDDDIIPPFEGYPGKNYMGDNILIYLNDCEVPQSTTTTTTEVSPTTTVVLSPSTTTTVTIPEATTTTTSTIVPVTTIPTTIPAETTTTSTIVPFLVGPESTTTVPVVSGEQELPRTGLPILLHVAVGLGLLLLGTLAKRWAH